MHACVYSQVLEGDCSLRLITKHQGMVCDDMCSAHKKKIVLNNSSGSSLLVGLWLFSATILKDPLAKRLRTTSKRLNAKKEMIIGVHGGEWVT